MTDLTIEAIAEKVAELSAINSGKALVSANKYGWSYDEQHPDVERGEVFSLAGLTNDARLLQDRFIRLLHGSTPIKCRCCAKKFRDADCMRMHYRSAHPEAHDTKASAA
jgi:hypothetical protein